ncbi:MAG: peptide deformylase [Bacteroidales bacterium]|nr:peptide deformylase [Bacteroidales bacterium]
MTQAIYLYGSEVLRAKAEELDLNQKEEIQALIADLKDTLAKADGCGLAAPQIGISKRAVIVDGTGMVDVYDYLAGFKRVMINPVITWESEEQCSYSEGCLSIPGVYADVVRPSKITVKYYNEDFTEVEETFDKFAARMVQHELSHLDGVVFTDLVAPIRKKMISKKLQNISKGKVHPHYNAKIR